MGDSNYEVLQAIGQRNFNSDLNDALQQAGANPDDIEGISYARYSEHSNKHFEELKTLLGGRSGSFPGASGSYWETSDKAALDILGDIDIRAEFERVNSTGLNRDIISKYTPTAQQSFEWRYNAFGSSEFVWSTTGANALTDILGIPNALAVRFTMDVVNGTDRILSWYYSDDDTLEGNWLHLSGSPKTVAGNTSIFSSNAVVRIGARGDGPGANAFSGNIRRVELRNLIDGTIVAAPDFRFLAPGTTSFNDGVGNTWNAVGNVAIV